MSGTRSPPADYGHLASIYGAGIWVDEAWDEPQSIFLAGEAILASMVCGLNYGGDGRDVHILIRLAPMLMLPEAQRCLRPQFIAAKRPLPGHRFCYTHFDIDAFRHEYFRWDGHNFGSLRVHEAAMCGDHHRRSVRAKGGMYRTPKFVFWAGFWGDLKLVMEIGTCGDFHSNLITTLLCGALCGGHIEIVQLVLQAGTPSTWVPATALPAAYEGPLARSQAVNRFLAKAVNTDGFSARFQQHLSRNLMEFGAPNEILEAVLEAAELSPFHGVPTLCASKYTFANVELLVQKGVLPSDRVAKMFSEHPPRTVRLHRELMSRYGCWKPTIRCFLGQPNIVRLMSFLEAELVDMSREAWMDLLRCKFRFPTSHMELVLEFYMNQHSFNSMAVDHSTAGRRHALKGTAIEDALYLVRHHSVLTTLLDFGCSRDFIPMEYSVSVREHYQELRKTDPFGAHELLSTLDGYKASRENRMES